MRRPLFCVCIAFTICMFIFMSFYDPNKENKIAYEGQSLSYVGKVYNKMIVKGKKYVFVSNGKGNILLVLDAETKVPKMGSTIEVEGTYKSFNIARNPGAFNQKEYYKLQGVNVQLTNVDIINESKNYSYYKEYLYCLRVKISELFDKSLKLSGIILEQDIAIIKAIVIGDKTDLDSENKQLFQRSGIAHILAISGLHISVIGMGLYELLKKIKMPKILSICVSVTIMFLYGQMVGMPTSAYRAILMFSLRMLSIICHRTYDILTALAMAAVAILIEQPLYLYNSGFLLSFGAVLGIAGLGDMIKNDMYEISFSKKNTSERERFFKRYLLRLQESACAGISIFLIQFPIMLMNYYEFPIYSFILNLIIIPTVGILMLQGIILILIMGIPYIIAYVFIYEVSKIMTRLSCLVCHYIIVLYELLCRLSLALPASRWVIGKPDTWRIAVFYAVVIILCIYHRVNIEIYDSEACLPFRIKMIIILTATLFLTQRTYGELKITFVDVGQGDGIWIENDNGNHYLIDSGSTSEQKLGEYTLAPFLKYNGTSKIDGIFLTHLDTDHTAGIQDLIENNPEIQIGRIVLAKAVLKDEKYDEFARLCEDNNIPLFYVKTGDIIRDNKLVFKVIHPASDYTSESPNACSIAMKIEYGSFRGLFAGDLEEDGELIIADILKKEGWKCNLYKASHHGSKYSNTEVLLNTIKPDIAVISCGKNSYGHPHKETLERLESVGCTIFRTDYSGAITFRIKNDRIKTQTYLK